MPVDGEPGILEPLLCSWEYVARLQGHPNRVTNPTQSLSIPTIVAEPYTSISIVAFAQNRQQKWNFSWGYRCLWMCITSIFNVAFIQYAFKISSYFLRLEAHVSKDKHKLTWIWLKKVNHCCQTPNKNIPEVRNSGNLFVVILVILIVIPTYLRLIFKIWEKIALPLVQIVGRLVKSRITCKKR